MTETTTRTDMAAGPALRAPGMVNGGSNTLLEEYARRLRAELTAIEGELAAVRPGPR